MQLLDVGKFPSARGVTTFVTDIVSLKSKLGLDEGNCIFLQVRPGKRGRLLKSFPVCLWLN